MTTYIKMAILNTETEAQLLDSILSEREIPHFIKSYLDTAYDGLFQASMGWGHIEAPEKWRDEITALLDELRDGTDAAES